jgi:outer membrane lipoprotein carrier protein
MNAITWIAILSVCAAVTPPPGDDAAAVVRGVQQRYDSTTDFTASVEQEIVVAGGGKTLTSTGTVAFQRPGKMRWTMQDHEKQIIVADGKTLWFYEPEERQVLKAPFQAAFRSSTPVSFLSGVGRIADNFDASIERWEGDRIELSLVPREKSSELGRLRLDVDAKTYDILGAEVTDALGNVTRIRFSKLVRNVQLPADLFQFQVPPGVDVIEAPIGY